MTKKYTLNDVKEWNSGLTQPYFSESTYNALANDTIRDQYVDALLLLRGITDYLNTFFPRKENVDWMPSDLDMFIFDETAYNLLIKNKLDNTETSINIEDSSIDALILINESYEPIFPDENSAYEKITNILVFQSKNSPKSSTSKVFKEPGMFLPTLFSTNFNKSDSINLARDYVNKVIGMNVSKIDDANVYNVLISSQAESHDAQSNVKQWIFEINNAIKNNNIQIDCEDPDIIEKSLFYVPDTMKRIKNNAYGKIAKENAVAVEKNLEITNLEFQPFYSEKVSTFSTFSYLKEYAKFLSDNDQKFDDQLTIDNVRGNQGLKSANKSIKNTLLNNSEDDILQQSISNIDFWWLNNGITIIADDITQSSPRTVKLRNPQIVNGQQTSRQIFSVKDLIYNPSWKVQIKIVIIKNINDPVSRKIREQIILGVNTQTAVSQVSITGLNPNVRSLSESIEKYSKDQWHIIVRKGEKPDTGNYFPYEFLLQMMVASIKKLPGEARSSITKVVNQFFNEIFSADNVKYKNEIMQSWISFMEIVKLYDDCFTSSWEETYGINREIKYGDKYAYLALFSVLVSLFHINPELKLIDKMAAFSEHRNSITEDFEQALKIWHNFMALQLEENSMASNLATYLKSSNLSTDLNNYLVNTENLNVPN